MRTYPFICRIVQLVIILILINSYRSSAQSQHAQAPNIISKSVVSLDGDWLLAKDSLNVGRTENWWKVPVPEARPIKVPWILQDVFPAYHGGRMVLAKL